MAPTLGTPASALGMELTQQGAVCWEPGPQKPRPLALQHRRQGRTPGPSESNVCAPGRLTCCPQKVVISFSTGAGIQGSWAYPISPTPLHCQAQRRLGARRLGYQAKEKPGVLCGISGFLLTPASHCGERAASAAFTGQPPTVGFVACGVVGVSLGEGAVCADMCLCTLSLLTQGWHISFQLRL